MHLPNIVSGVPNILTTQMSQGVEVAGQTGVTVIVPTEIKDWYTASPENCQSITIIEIICADGSPLLVPLLIGRGEEIMENGFRIISPVPK